MTKRYLQICLLQQFFIYPPGEYSFVIPFFLVVKYSSANVGIVSKYKNCFVNTNTDADTIKAA